MSACVCVCNKLFPIILIIVDEFQNIAELEEGIITEAIINIMYITIALFL